MDNNSDRKYNLMVADGEQIIGTKVRCIPFSWIFPNSKAISRFCMQKNMVRNLWYWEYKTLFMMIPTQKTG